MLLIGLSIGNLLPVTPESNYDSCIRLSRGTSETTFEPTLTPPGPIFRDVAELERLAEPTGIIVVENGLYIVRYMLNASVWTVGFLFLGLVEYTVRTGWKRLPAVPSPISLVSIPASREQAVGIATVGGVLHAVVMLWFALRLGLTVSGEFGWLL